MKAYAHRIGYDHNRHFISVFPQIVGWVADPPADEKVSPQRDDLQQGRSVAEMMNQKKKTR